MDHFPHRKRILETGCRDLLGTSVPVGDFYDIGAIEFKDL